MQETNEESIRGLLRRIFRGPSPATPPPDCTASFKIKAPVCDVDRRPYAFSLSGHPENACLPFAPDAFFSDDHPSAVQVLTIARLDPAFRPEGFPPEADVVLDERFCPGVGTLRPGDWVCAHFQKTRDGWSAFGFLKLASHNVAHPIFRKP